MSIINWFINLKKINEHFKNLEKRISKLEKLNNKKSHVLNSENKDMKKILDLTKKPISTKQIAKKLGKSRTWASRLVNQLEKQGKVVEFSKKDREIFYKLK